MLGKLLKYDLKYMIKNMTIFYILSIFFALTTRLLFSLEQSVIINIISQISLGCMFSMIASTLINTVMRIWVRFRDSLYKDEAYLTHTLPVTKNELYNSKFIQTFIFFIIGFIVVLSSLFIVYYSDDNWSSLINYISSITNGLNINNFSFVLMAIVLIFLEVFNGIQSGFYGIILGHKRNSGKLGFSILFGFFTYLVSQILVLALIFITGLFDSSIMALFQTTDVTVDINALKFLAIFSSICYLAIIFVMSILCKNELNKGVNIE